MTWGDVKAQQQALVGSIVMENNLYFIHLPGSHFFRIFLHYLRSISKEREKSLFCIISELTQEGTKSRILHFQNFIDSLRLCITSQNGLKKLLILVNILLLTTLCYVNTYRFHLVYTFCLLPMPFSTPPWGWEKHLLN